MKFIWFILEPVRNIICLSFVSRLVALFVKLHLMLFDRRVQQVNKNDRCQLVGGFYIPGLEQDNRVNQDIYAALRQSLDLDDKAFRDKRAKALRPFCF